MSQDPSEKPAPRPLEVPQSVGEARIDALNKLVAIVDRLRAPDGCPWDREQTAKSVAPHLVEEAHEVLDAVESKTEADVIEESGDLLMGIVLLARIEEQAGRFSLADVANAVCEKLVRRHPHVFGDVQVDGAEQALNNWERIKQQEREAKQTDSSAIAGVPAGMPALQRAKRVGEKAMSAGFRWTNATDALAKVGEEVRELEEVFERTGPPKDDAAREALERELGDVLLAAAFLGNYLKIDPERAARDAVRRFERRFRSVEHDCGGSLVGQSLDTMMAAWRRAKAAEGVG
ncbi:MAG: nucleoside triphosphate pyrophosphohydrolase [Planctomycetes bacterium]|nr:nucleoside triphosphate pyrophosphohydrolase [Planctomycetota bacterium]